MKKYKVVLFDDNKHIRDSIKMLLDTSPDFELQKAYAEAGDAAEQLKVWQPDLVLMDIDMPGVNGMDAVLAIRNSNLHMPVIMLTVYDDADRVFRCLRNGAMGYLLKNTQPDKLLEAMREVIQGGAPMTPSIARKVMIHFQSEMTIPKNYNLSDREKEVLKLLVDGKSYKMIAAELEIGFETVRTYIRRIYDKLHVQSMTEAVAKSIKERLV
jgi:DNA-binding NarL/FixJ family response regulator